VDSLVDGSLFVSAFVTLFVIMDPVGTVPIFLSLTGGYALRTYAVPRGRRCSCRWS
jgi:multiple antibiotic resistance protein